MNSTDLKILLSNIDPRIKNCGLILGTFRKEPHSLAVKFGKHFNTIGEWHRTDWRQMRVRDLIELLAFLERLEREQNK